MRHVVLVGALVGTLGLSTAQAQPAGSTIGTITLAKKVMADGKPLAAGTYTVRLTSDEAKPAAVGEAPNSERWVEFVKGGKVAGREVATVISKDDIGQIAKGTGRPKTNGSRVELLKGGDYWRVWIDKGGTNYIINLPPGA